MFLYNITLQRATGITHAIHGNFSGEVAHFSFISSLIIQRLALDRNIRLKCFWLPKFVLRICKHSTLSL